MCSIGDHYIEHPTINYDTSSGGSRHIPDFFELKTSNFSTRFLILVHPNYERQFSK